MRTLFAWLDNVPNAPFWLATAAVLVSGLLIAGAVRLSRGRAREDPEREIDLGKPVTAGDPFMQGSFSERRKAPRRRGGHIAVLVSDAEGEVEPVRGWVVDRSVTGLGLELEEEGEVDVGTVLSIRPAEGAVIPWVKVEVRNRHKHEGAWHLGCQFLKPPSADVMMRFG